MTKRYLFSFDDRAQRMLDQLYENGAFSSKGEAVRESIHIAQSLQAQANQDYTEVVVRNPHNQRERVMIIPILTGPKKSGKARAMGPTGAPTAGAKGKSERAKQKRRGGKQ